MSLRVLIFATSYVATEERLKLLDQWIELHRRLNADCKLWIVDSRSPLLWAGDGGPLHKLAASVTSFPDNIGHLSKGGEDGWGRAFCHGLYFAIDDGFDYVVHIEGDSLFRLPVMPIVEQMARDGIKVASVPIGYGEAQRSTWVETGLMFFDVEYLKNSRFIAGYDWPNRKARPQPEIVIRKMLGNDLVMLPLKAERSDKGEITVDNVAEFDWITHCKPEVYDRFVEIAEVQ
jgi:hypothetical protein